MSGQVISQADSMSSLTSLASMLVGLMVVLAVIFALVFLLKRFNLMPAQNSVIKTLATNVVGQKERVVLIELEGQQYLLGVTAQQINLIDKLAVPVTVPESAFSQRLRQAKTEQV